MQIDADASMKMEDEGRRIRRGNTPHLPSTEKTRKKKKQEEYREETRRDIDETHPTMCAYSFSSNSTVE